MSYCVVFQIKKRNGVDDEPPSESKLKFRPFQVPPIGGVDDHNEENQLQPWDSNDGGAGAGDDTDAARKELDEKPRPAKVYGPKAVLKKGQLGNYEPTHLKDRGGPGGYSNHCRDGVSGSTVNPIIWRTKGDQVGTLITVEMGSAGLLWTQSSEGQRGTTWVLSSP